MRTIWIGFLLVVLAAVCHGQARYAGTGPGSLVVVGTTAGTFKLDYGHRNLGSLGMFVDLNPSWRFGVEGEFARTRVHSDAETRYSTYLVGPRISLRPHRLDPYVKVLAGLGRFSFPYGYATGNYFVIAPGAGVDWRASDRVRLRLVDFEYQEWPQFTFGQIHPYGISAGFSVSLVRSGTKRGDWHSQ